MLPFVDDMLQRIHLAASDAEIEQLLGDLASQLLYRSAFLLDFPLAKKDSVRLWDSNPARRDWWLAVTDNGSNSISRSLADNLARGGVQHDVIAVDDPRHPFAVQYDFVSTTLVPITFESKTRGVAAFVGEERDLSALILPLQIVCYALLMQARGLREDATTSEAILTPRERQIMELSARGLTSEAVAAELGISTRTINQHIENITGKLGTRNRVHTVAEAIRRGLLA
ncbi:hypothetical protein VW35_03520 [Devosia soli]|uniref:HTH luxR-type domain-containing protein n=1 Tax=Devosia soli TaxID=361041 RepID=A0A0F5LFU5_9HYPH|nr:helix-turn-helix transcriptional regulator [Devosia soli]KKB81213.1 hypothetical protein VW35_03520 [Devosia soli]